MLERPTIKRDFESKYSVIVRLLEEEMDSTKKIFDKQVKIKQANKPVEVHRNLPEVSGLLKWCQELRDRIQNPMQSFNKLIDHPIKDSVEMQRVRKKYEELISLLSDHFNNGVSMLASYQQTILKRIYFYAIQKQRQSRQILIRNWSPLLEK